MEKKDIHKNKRIQMFIGLKTGLLTNKNKLVNILKNNNNINEKTANNLEKKLYQSNFFKKNNT
ncbi:hypothetical protein OY14_04365 (plasmid) [Borreliella chilensis]|uniref:Uncharacterized protein n=1 Tax=Borreliella chilensis TaxID=1245910 RepID=A0A0A7UWP3_9SPIR|nr:hypothetical protein OY14_04365 [Borreliella chilensis]